MAIGSTFPACGPVPQIPISHSLCVRAFKDWVKAKHADRWMDYGGGLHTKCFLLASNEEWFNKPIDMDRNNISTVVGAITGHCNLNSHIRKMWLSVTSECTFKQDETDTHVICAEFFQLRRSSLSDYVIMPSEVLEVGSSVLNKFLVETGWFEWFKWWRGKGTNDH